MSFRDRFQQLAEDYREDILLALGVALIAFTAFGLGRATAPLPEKTKPFVEDLAPPKEPQRPVSEPLSHENPSGQRGQFVASKNGTRYYLPSCAAAKRIKEENRIWFASAEEAQRAGYLPAANCPGL
jgi:hypothetical protein